jgi:hypothetical protein
MKTHFLRPKPTNQISAISSGIDGPSKELCCQPHGLQQELHNASLQGTWGPQEGIELNLLGFSYIQDFTSAMSLGEMDIVAQMETLLQVPENWYLVNNQGQFTGPITCLKASSSEIFLKPEVNQFYVLLSCCLQLQDHLIILDLSQSLTPQSSTMSGIWKTSHSLTMGRPTPPNGSPSWVTITPATPPWLPSARL